jgi:hypothetical protein
MPAPRKPTEHLQLSGAFAHDPKRAAGRSLETAADDLCAAPADLPADVQTAWNEIRDLAEPGLLKAHHFLTVRSGARLLARENTGTITTQERAQLWKFFEQFGMTPRSRSYVNVKPTQAKTNPFEDLKK